jgi:D-2-hydroxyacid dehydrogenase (NADP+)
VLGRVDVVVVACPLTPETRGSSTRSALQRCGPVAYLINVARGAIVVTTTCSRRSRTAGSAGAAMDAFDEEPLPADDPLWDAPNFTVTPHTSFKSPRNLDRVIGEFEDNLAASCPGAASRTALRDAALGY